MKYPRTGTWNSMMGSYRSELYKLATLAVPKMDLQLGNKGLSSKVPGTGTLKPGRFSRSGDKVQPPSLGSAGLTAASEAKPPPKV